MGNVVKCIHNTKNMLKNNKKQKYHEKNKKYRFMTVKMPLFKNMVTYIFFFGFQNPLKTFLYQNGGNYNFYFTCAMVFFNLEMVFFNLIYCRSLRGILRLQTAKTWWSTFRSFILERSQSACEGSRSTMNPWNVSKTIKNRQCCPMCGATPPTRAPEKWMSIVNPQSI